MPTVAVTPLPKVKMAVLSVVLLTESICTTVLVPFVGFFVAYLLGWEVEQAGYASGFLIGLYMLGQVLSSTFWASVSDTYGRKVALVCGCFGSSICVLLFGLSTTIYQACFFRFVHGLFGGNSPVAKTMIVDLTDKTNQVKGFAIVSLTWGVGTLIGPSVGGFLYDPHSSDVLSTLFSETSFFSTHPAALPTLVVSVYCMFATIFCCFCIVETNPRAVPLSHMLPDCCRSLEPVLRFIQPVLPSNKIVIVSQESEEGMEPHTPPPITGEGESAQMKGLGYGEALRLPRLRTVCIISMLMSVADMLYAETLPLWAIASRSVGGINLTHQKVAVLTLLNCIPGIGANIVFAYILSFFTEISLFWAFTHAMYGLWTFLVPFAVYTKGAAFYYTLACNMVRKLFEAWDFATLMLAVARAAPEGQVSSTYAVQQGYCCIVRCIVPFIGAPLFAFSIAAERPFPFNHFLCFLLCFIPLLIAAAVTLKYQFTANEEEVETEGGTLKNTSFAGSAHSHRSFLDGIREHSDSEDYGNEPLFLKNSFVSLATSFATNPVPNLLQPTIVPIFPSYNDREEGYGLDSREASNQGSEVGGDDNSEYLIERMEEDKRISDEGELK